jgi:uncharacterized protein YbaR (Trm112 family)
MADKVVFEYLTIQESDTLITELKHHSISSAYKQVMSVKQIPNVCYVFVSESDLNRAIPIVNRYKEYLSEKRGNEKLVCPNCKSKPPITHHKDKKDLSFLKKVFTIGTSVMVCNKCGNEWYI